MRSDSDTDCELQKGQRAHAGKGHAEAEILDHPREALGPHLDK